MTTYSLVVVVRSICFNTADGVAVTTLEGFTSKESANEAAKRIMFNNRDTAVTVVEKA
jgi:hypothetical protein